MCLESLVAKSLIKPDGDVDGVARFQMLETIREFSAEQLEATGETVQVRERHAAYFLNLAEAAEARLLGHEQIAWLRRLSFEHDNMRAVLAWSRDGMIPAVIGLRLAGSLIWYWFFRGTISEGRRWVEAMLAQPAAAPRTVVRARALLASAWLTNWQGDYVGARSDAQEGTAIFREIGDLRDLARSLCELAVTEMNERNLAAARLALEEGVAAARAVGDQWGLAFVLGQLSAVAQFEGNTEAARALREESASIARSIGDRFTLSVALAGLGLAARTRGDHEESAARFRESLVMSSQLDDARIVPRALAGLAGVATLQRDLERAARLFGVAEAFREASGARESPLWEAIVEQDVADLRATLGDTVRSAIWSEGRAMPLEQGLSYALQDD